MNKIGNPDEVAADAAYKTPVITKYLHENEMTPSLPYSWTTLRGLEKLAMQAILTLAAF